MRNKELLEMTNMEIWDGWCGSASPHSPEGQFVDFDDALAYVRDRQRDWAAEPADNDRTIGDLTDAEIEFIAHAILNYSKLYNS